MTAPNVGIRGIRQSLPSGVLIGRLSSGSGRAEIVAMADLAHALNLTKQIVAGSGIALHQGKSLTFTPNPITGAGTIDVTSITAGLVSSNGTILEATALNANGGLTWSTGTLTNTGVLSFVAGNSLSGGTVANGGTVSVTSITAGLVSSNGTILEATTLAGALTWVNGLLTNTGIASLVNGTGITISGGNTITNSGVVLFGAAAGTITLGTGVSMSGQTLNVSGSAILPIVGSVIVGGTLNAGGTLDTFIGGGASNTIAAAGDFSVITGGTTNTINGLFGGFIGGGKSNTLSANADYSSIVGGRLNTVSGVEAVVVGGVSCTASGTQSIAGGFSAAASGIVAVALGDNLTGSGRASFSTGSSNTNAGSISFVHGRAGDSRGNFGAHVHGGDDGGTTFPSNTAFRGFFQTEHYNFLKKSSSATAFRLTTDGGTAGAANVAALANRSSQFFNVLLVAKDVTTHDTVTYSLTGGLINREANAASTVMGTGMPVFIAGPVIGASVIPAVPTVTADTTNGGYNISFTPPVANTNTWMVEAWVAAANVIGS